MEPNDELDADVDRTDLLKKLKLEHDAVISAAILNKKAKEEASHLDLGYDLGELPAGYDNR